MSENRLTLWGLYTLQVLFGTWATRDISIAVVFGLITVIGILGQFWIEKKTKVDSEAPSTTKGKGTVRIVENLALPLLRTGIQSIKGRPRFQLSLALVLIGVPCFLFILLGSGADCSGIRCVFGALIPSLLLCQGFLIFVVNSRVGNDWLPLRNCCEQWILPLAVAGIIIATSVSQYRGSEPSLVATCICAVAGLALFNEALTRKADSSTQATATRANGVGRVAIQTSMLSSSRQPKILVLGAFALTAWTVSLQLDRSLPAVQGWMDTTIANSAGSFPTASFSLNYRYVSDATLSSVTQQVLDSPQQIAFRAYSQVPPGYLRGRVFETYHNGRWSPTPFGSAAAGSRVISPSRRETEETDGGVVLNHFQLAPTGDGRKVIIEIRNDPTRGNFFFTPLGTESMEGSGTLLRVDRNDIPRSGFRTQYPYRAIVGEAPSRGTSESINNGEYLAVPEELSVSIRTIGQSLCSGVSGVSAKAQAIESYFRTEFEYSLEPVPAPEDTDPILYFLKTKHPAHCEYFATSATLLLRSVGIPSRYVTGYIATELADNEEYWLARNRNAHAWVEAYDASRFRWFIVEPTPGRNIVEVDFGRDTDSLNASNLQPEIDQRDTSTLASLYRWLATFNQESAVGNIIDLLRVSLLWIVLLWFLLRFVPHHVQKLRTGKGLEPHQKELRSLDRMAAKLGHRRRPSETIHKFAMRLEMAPDANQQHVKLALTELACRYRDHALLRYAGKERESS